MTLKAVCGAALLGLYLGLLLVGLTVVMVEGSLRAAGVPPVGVSE